MKNRLSLVALTSLALAVFALGCGRIQARAAFQDGNKAYKDENFKQAIIDYQKAVQHDPQMAAAHFYLASSHQALYRPGKDDPENKAHLDAAIEQYKKTLEVDKGVSENDKKVRLNTLGALTAIYSEDPYRDFDTAEKYAKELVQENPNDLKNLFAMANLYEKFEKYDLAEETYKKAADDNPGDVKACGALAGFYNKPLWEGKSRFDEAVAVLERCAELAPNDPTGFYKVATFYWDKAYRDPLLNDEEKDAYADKGLAAVDKALEMKPDYVDAIVYKGLLFRVKAQVSKNPRTRFQFLEQAQTLQKQALQLKKAQELEAAPEESASQS